MLKRWQYRVWQGLTRLRAVTGRHRVNLEPARELLSVEEWRLFCALTPGDQEHALCVLRRVQRLSTTRPALVRAALLHDTGKAGTGLDLGWRVLVVILGAVGLLERAASPNPRSWRHPVYLHLHHAERGARMCADAGCEPDVVALVRWHDTKPEFVTDETVRIDLALLQAADDAC